MQKPTFVLALAALAIAPYLKAQETNTVVSPMVGFEKLSLQGRGDSRIGIPVLRKPVFIGKIGAVTPDTISLAGAEWTAQQFSQSSEGRPRYYLEIVTGNLKGLILPIIGNQAQELELDTETNLTAHPSGALITGTNGDMAQIRPCYEIQEVFGATEGESVLTPVASIPAPGSAGDRIMVPDNETVGFFKPPTTELYYVAGSGWRSRGGGNDDEGSYPLLPGQALTIRKFSGRTDVFVLGHVEQPRVLNLIRAGVGTESLLTLRGSEPLSLLDSGLYQSGVIRDSASELERGDELLWSDPPVPGVVQSTDRHFIHVAGTGWVELGNPTGVQNLLLQPGGAFLIRKRDESPDAWWLK